MIETGLDRRCLLVGEIGANHNGKIENAKALIDQARVANWDAVKGQKRCLDPGVLFDRDELDREYNSPHAFGRTYGEHRHALEFSIDDHVSLAQYARSIGLSYGVSVWDPVSAKEVIDRAGDFDFIKIPSPALTFQSLVSYLGAQTRSQMPLVVSMGMTSHRDAIAVWADHLSEYGSLADSPASVFFMVTTSAYPALVMDLHLSRISFVRETLDAVEVGLSGHWEFDPTSDAMIIGQAVAMGAAMIERHITLRHDDKGSDHSLSLDQDQMIKTKRFVDQAIIAHGSKHLSDLPCEQSARAKLRTKVIARDCDPTWDEHAKINPVKRCESQH